MVTTWWTRRIRSNTAWRSSWPGQFYFCWCRCRYIVVCVWGDNKFYAGAAYSHLNNPSQSLVMIDLFWPIKLQFTRGTVSKIIFASTWSSHVFKATGIWTQCWGPVLNLSRKNPVISNNHFSLRLVSQSFEKPFTTDAVIVSSRFDFNNYGIGLSYDLNISSLRPIK